MRRSQYKTKHRLRVQEWVDREGTTKFQRIVSIVEKELGIQLFGNDREVGHKAEYVEGRSFAVKLYIEEVYKRKWPDKEGGWTTLKTILNNRITHANLYYYYRRINELIAIEKAVLIRWERVKARYEESTRRYVLSIKGELPAMRRTDLPYTLCNDSISGYEKVVVEGYEAFDALMNWYIENNARGKVIGVFRDEATLQC